MAEITPEELARIRKLSIEILLEAERKDEAESAYFRDLEDRWDAAQKAGVFRENPENLKKIIHVATGTPLPPETPSASSPDFANRTPTKPRRRPGNPFR